MMKRLLSGLVALSLSLWQVAPAYAGHREPVDPTQNPADIGDVARPAGSNTTTIQPGAVTAGKMATGAAVGNLGYTPLNKAGDSSSGVQTFSAPAAIDLSQAGTPNPTISKLTSGIGVSFCPALSCINSPSDQPTTPTPSFFDHQRASLLLSGATRDDGHSEEQTLAVTTTIGTGFVKPYAASTAYSLGDNTTVGNAVYRVVVAGTTGANSAPPGTRPTAAQGGAYQVVDGSVTWQWVNDAAIAAKVGSYFETKVVPGAGAAWGAAFNYHITATPKAGMFLPGIEMDYANDSGTGCALGIDCTALRLAVGGNQVTHALEIQGGQGISFTTSAAVAAGATTLPVTSTAGLATGQFVLGPYLTNNVTITAVGAGTITVSSGLAYGVPAATTYKAAGNFSTMWAHRIDGDFIASNQALEIDAATPVGLGFGVSGVAGLGTHSIATIQDNTTSPASLSLGGSNSVADIYIGAPTSGTPNARAFQINGPFASSVFEDNSTSPTTFNIGGKHSIAGIVEGSTSQNGISLSGTYANTQIIGKNWKVDPNGNITAPQESLTSTTASTSSTTGALTVAGGVGVGGALNVSGTSLFNSMLTASGAANINGVSGTTALQVTGVGASPARLYLDFQGGGTNYIDGPTVHRTAGGTATIATFGNGGLTLASGATLAFGTFTSGTATNTGYITITDAGGTTRHLAVVP